MYVPIFICIYNSVTNLDKQLISFTHSEIVRLYFLVSSLITIIIIFTYLLSSIYNKSPKFKLVSNAEEVPTRDKSSGTQCCILKQQNEAFSTQSLTSSRMYKAIYTTQLLIEEKYTSVLFVNSVRGEYSF